MADAVLPAPAPPAAPPSDEWRARDRNERELLRRFRQIDLRAGRSLTCVVEWNGVMLKVLTTEQVR